MVNCFPDLRAFVSHVIYRNVNFSHMSASLRTDSDPKAALVCSGHGNVIRDMQSKCVFYRQLMPNCSPKVQTRNGEKEFFN